MMGRENLQQYGSYIDLSTGSPLDSLVQNGLQNPFGYDVVGSGTVMPNYHLMDDYARRLMWPQAGAYPVLEQPDTLDPVRSQESREQVVVDMCNIGDNWFYQGRNEEAIVAYDLALGQDPENARVLTSKGAALAGLGSWSEALAISEQAIAHGSSGYAAFNTKALALAGLGYNEEALTVLLHDAMPKDDMVVTRINYAALLIRVGRYPEARARLETYARGNELDFVVYNNLGVAQTELGNYKEAWDALSQAKTLEPSYRGEVSVNQAYLFIRAGRYAEAHQAINDSLLCGANFAGFTAADKADTLMHYGQYAEAARLLREASLNYPTNLNSLEFKLLALFGEQKNRDAFISCAKQLRGGSQSLGRTISIVDINS